MSAPSRSNSNFGLTFDGTEIQSLNHTDFDNLSCERVVAKPTGEGLSNCDLGEACASAINHQCISNGNEWRRADVFLPSKKLRIFNSKLLVEVEAVFTYLQYVNQQKQE